MHSDRWLALALWTSDFGPAGWPEVVAGYDFGLLGTADIQRWLRRRGVRGEAGAALLALSGARLVDFEATLWAACAEETGAVPRPGSRAWSRAQDRWRRALLREAVAQDRGEAVLAQAIEGIYDAVGCPEDMLDLWCYRPPWQEPALRVNFEALYSFLGDRAAAAVA